MININLLCAPMGIYPRVSWSSCRVQTYNSSYSCWKKSLLGLNVSYNVSTKEKLPLSLAPSRRPPREAANYLNSQGSPHWKVDH